MLLPFTYDSTFSLLGTIISCFLIGKWNNDSVCVCVCVRVRVCLQTCMHVYQDMVVVDMFLFAFI